MPIHWTNVATDNIQTIWTQSPLKCKPLNRAVRTCWTHCCYPLMISTLSYAERCTCCLELGYPDMPAGICICFYAKEQQLYTELSWMSELLKPFLRLRPDAAQRSLFFSLLDPWPCPCSHYPELMTIGDGPNVHRLVNPEHCLVNFFLTTLVMYSFTSDVTQTTCPSPASQHL